MSYVSDAVGLIYEDKLQTMFPELQRSDKPNHPDFTTGTFHIEAKAGYRDYGVRLKRYQVEEFPKIELPTVYAIGYHAFPGLMQFKDRKSKLRLVQKMMILLHFPEQYLVSDNIIQAIWEQERRTSSRGFEYCTAKRRFLEQIIRGGPIVRRGQQQEAHRVYGVNPSDFVLKSPTPRTFGMLLHRVRDAEALHFLKRYKKI